MLGCYVFDDGGRLCLSVLTLQDKMEKQSKLLANLSEMQDTTAFVPKCPRNGCLFNGKWYFVPSNGSDWTPEFGPWKRFLLLVINNATQQASIEKTIGNATHWIELKPSNETVTERPLVLLGSNISEQCNYFLRVGTWTNVSCKEECE
ncbi:uncharacterized protein LOC144669006 [Cetorhinus maximus]